MTNFAKPSYPRPDDAGRYNPEFVVPSGIYHQPVESGHWQLQDCLVCPEKRHELYGFNNNAIYKYNTRTRHVDTITSKYSFIPVSLNIGFDHAVITGNRGELSVINLHSKVGKSVRMGATINNCIGFSHDPLYMTPQEQRNTTPHLLVSSNDRSIRILSFPDLVPMGKITMPQAVNHTAVSPDGRLMVTVSDDDTVKVFDIRGSTYTMVQTLNTGHQASYSCNWNRLSDQFAVATAQGYVDVYDIRFPRKLAQIRSTELEKYINVVDTRNFEEVQRIRVGEDRDPITGVTFSPDGSTLYAGMRHRILEYDVNTLDRCRFGTTSLA
ncbi:hypothetical protein H4R34_001898 [Dimargaris verticillata]|uniref:DUF2415 domain-containing protein n=1 Tax=Dimargaris verticillata TaxID=2761393 RepID=A0A9W8EDD0_9FUNG|nr:hypothetical protein H4R34_001898 [Dimargaris verticillata]